MTAAQFNNNCEALTKMNPDIVSPDYNDTNLGDPRETPEEREIEKLSTRLAMANKLQQITLDNQIMAVERADKAGNERDEWRSRFEALDRVTTMRIDVLWREQQWLARHCIEWMKRYAGTIPVGHLGLIVPSMEELMIEAERAVTPPDEDEDEDSESSGGEREAKP